MKRLLSIFVATSIIASSSAAYAKEAKPVELSDSEIANLQKKEYDVPYTVLFPAVMATLQNAGYINVNANRDSGTVTAQTEAKGKVVYNLLTGFGKKKRTQLASIFMEPRGEGRSAINLRVTSIVSKSSIYGSRDSDGLPVKFAEPYSDFYSVLSKEVASRSIAPAVVAPVSASVSATETAPTAN